MCLRQKQPKTMSCLGRHSFLYGWPARWVIPFWQPACLYICVHMCVFLVANKLCCCCSYDPARLWRTAGFSARPAAVHCLRVSCWRADWVVFKLAVRKCKIFVAVGLAILAMKYWWYHLSEIAKICCLAEWYYSLLTSLESRRNSINMKFVHWLLMVGCYIWYEDGTGWGPSPPSPNLAVPNVTAHPSTVIVY